MTGSLQEKNGMYQMVFNIKDANGKRKQKWVSTGLPVKGRNKRKAEQMLTQMLAEHADGGFIEPSKMLYCDFLSDWIKSNKQNYQATTYMNYMHMLDRHIYPYFKKTNLLLTDVTPSHIQRYYTSKTEEGLSPNTVIKHHAIMRTALQYAVKTKQIKENPCDVVVKPKRKRYVAEYYTAEEIQLLLDVSKGSTIEVPIFIAVYFGLRRSEIFGLKWSAIDPRNKVLKVCHKVVRAKEDGKMVNIATDDLKTETSYRVLPLDERLLNFLMEVRHQQEQNQALCGDAYNGEYLEYVCVNGLGVRHNPDYITDVFGKIIARNDMKHIRFHDLRHSCASMLLSLGYSMKDIQEWLGHSNFQTTANIYSHVDPRNKKEMIRGLSSALDAKKSDGVPQEPSDE